MAAADPGMVDRARPKGRMGRRTLVVAVSVAIAIAIVVSVIVAVLYTVPMMSAERTSVTTYVNSTETSSEAPGPAEGQYSLLPSVFCRPSQAVGNYSVTLAWNASSVINSTLFGWVVQNGSESNWTVHWFYSANNTIRGHLALSQGLELQACHNFQPVILRWIAPAGIVVDFSVVSEYEYAVQVPYW